MIYYIRWLFTKPYIKEHQVVDSWDADEISVSEVLFWKVLKMSLHYYEIAKIYRGQKLSDLKFHLF